jgi:adenylate cyclase
VNGRNWEGVLKNGVGFVQYFDPKGKFAYRSPSSLLSGRATVEDDRLCQIIEGYLLNRQTCGYVYRNAADPNHPGLTYAYVSIDALKFFSVSP